MKIYQKIKPYIISTCISFTIVSLIQNALFTDSTLNTRYLPYHIFFVCVCVSALMFLTDKLPIKTTLSRVIISIIDMLVVVFGLNYFIIKMFYEDVNSTGQELVLSVILLIMTYFIVYSLSCIKNKSDEISINEQIKSRQNSTKNK